MRITANHLKSKVQVLNRLAGHGEDPECGTPGAFKLSSAYGGYSVHRFMGAGEQDLMGGHHTARECAIFIDGMRAGLTDKVVL